MSEKEFKNNLVDKDQEKVLYRINNKVCFACGEQIEKEPKMCPFCKTPLS